MYWWQNGCLNIQGSQNFATQNTIGFPSKAAIFPLKAMTVHAGKSTIFSTIFGAKAIVGSHSWDQCHNSDRHGSALGNDWGSPNNHMDFYCTLRLLPCNWEAGIDVVFMWVGYVEISLGNMWEYLDISTNFPQHNRHNYDIGSMTGACRARILVSMDPA